MALIMVVAGFLFVSVSAYLPAWSVPRTTRCLGITICTILFASVILMFLLPKNSPIGAVAGDHDRRGGVLRGLGRRRQPAGPQGRPHRRRDAVEAAADAGDRRLLLRAGDGAGAQPAVRGLRHRRADAGASAIR
jgi:hypothetical protein